MKRKDYINWDDMFMGIAAIASFRSKDPSTQHGAVIVDSKHKILGVGYNGFPRGLSDDIFPWTAPEKYKYVVHAEKNAILNATSNIERATLYLFSVKGYYPCSECAQMIAQKGIEEVVLCFGIDKNTKVYDWEATRKIFNHAETKVKVRFLKNPLSVLKGIDIKFGKVIDEMSNYIDSKNKRKK